MKTEYADKVAGIGATERSQSAIDYTHTVLEQARDLVARAEALADRLVGSVPTACDPAGQNELPGGILPSLQDHASAVRNRIADGLEALARIERAL